jgi:hypothetical protein
MSTRWARVLRGLIAASVAVFVADLAGGASAPGFAGLALTFAFSTLVCIALAGRTLARWRIAASVVLSQGAFHLLFLLFGNPASMTAQSGGMQMGMPVAASGVTTGLPPLAESGWMWAAHAVAAALTIVALFWGESAFWTVLASARLAFSRALRLHAVVTVMPHRPSAPIVVVRDRRDAHYLVTGLRHRGPPTVVPAFG